MPCKCCLDVEYMKFHCTKHKKKGKQKEKREYVFRLVKCTYCSTMLFHSLLSEVVQLFPIESGGTWIVLLLCIGCNAIVLSEKLGRICITAQLHLPQLNPCPVRIQICRTNKCQMNAQIPMDCWAINTDEHTIRHRWPGWIFCTAIKTCLQMERKTNNQKLIFFYYSFSSRDHVPINQCKVLALYACNCTTWLIQLEYCDNTLLVGCARSRWKTASMSLLDGPLVLAIL